MSDYLRRHRVMLMASAVILLAVGAVITYWLLRPPPTRPLPGPGDPAYEEYVEAFLVGVAAIDVGVGDVAEQNLSTAIALIPAEPASWADRGLLHLRTNRLPEAERDLTEAQRLAPENADIEKLLGVLDDRRGRFAEAVSHLRRAVEKDPKDVEALYFLAQIVAKEQTADSDAEYQRLMEQILAIRPDNRHALLERLRLAARRSDRAAVNDSLARFRALAPGWTRQDTRTHFAELERAAAGPLGPAIVDPLLIFANFLKAEPGYAQAAEELSPAGGYTGNPLRSFVRLEPPRHTPAPPDTGITFSAEPVAAAPAGRWDLALPVWLSGNGPPTVFVASAKEARRVGDDRSLPGLPLAHDGLVPFDWNNDLRMDLFMVGPAGVRFYLQDKDGGFTDVTAKTTLPTDVLKGDYAAALAADVDLDGDLDIVIARRTGAPVLLRNNFDASFTAVPIFADVDGGRAFAWADLDNDGAPDAAILDARGRLHVFANERSGQFRRWPAAVPADPFQALAVTDANDDGVLDLALVRRDGAVVRLSDQKKRASWDAAELARWEQQSAAEPGALRLFTGDLDNNGVPDLLASGPSGSAAWLGSAGAKFTALGVTLPPRIAAAVDLENTGRLDLLALDGDGRPVRYRNRGEKNYHWQTIRFRAAQAVDPTGDNRINSFGIGGEIEARTGTYVVKRPITTPAVHFGLGDRNRSDVVRIQWPNGVSQIEFRPAIDTVVVAEQRLKGSCPFLFTWNGERFVFATDFMWSTPLGMYINAQDKGGFLQTNEWVRVRGDQLVPRDGFYEVRVNANLWETHFFDHLTLQVVDHPADTEMYVDERFALEPMKPHFLLTGPVRPVARAWDHRGADATEDVRAVDGRHLDRSGRGLYQGITTDHWVEVDLGDDAPREGTVWLVAHGWVHPTDSSINYALEQGRNERPRALVLEVPDGKGGWKLARDKIGFPAGKNKTVLIRLDGIEGPGVSRRFRLRTNMEIYWDALHVAVESRAKFDQKELIPAVADIRARGILAMTQASPSSPELPDYDRLLATPQPWRDLVGYHTRFGDVRELLRTVDDRYVIVNAGDEIVMRFPVPAGPPPGWKRDFLWVSDGWVKDGDLNTRFGKTVLPLPAHDLADYTTAPGRLEDDPVYRRHRKDWDIFHTRFVTPSVFERGLRNFR